MPNPLERDLDHVLTLTGGLWTELRGARLFLTGGTGFFGCWMLETFLWAHERLALDASIVVLTRGGGAFRAKVPHLASHPAVTLLEGDVRSFAFPDGAFSHVIHAAADATPALTQRDRQRVFATIVEGTRRTLECACRSGAARFLFTSSGAVYGPQPAGLAHLPEEYTGGPDPANACRAGAEAKRAAEMLCALHADARLRPTIARCFSFVGPYLPLDAHFAAGNFIRDALRGGPICVLGDGTPYRSYLYASDLAIWLWTILLRGEPVRPYNVGSAEPLTILDVARLVGRTFTPPVPVSVARAPAPGAAIERYVPAVARAETELGLRRTVAVEEGIRRTVAWHTKTGRV
jgi:nucleoside-diphosphate-sugar epimerase